MKFHLYYLT